LGKNRPSLENGGRLRRDSSSTEKKVCEVEKVRSSHQASRVADSKEADSQNKKEKNNQKQRLWTLLADEQSQVTAKKSTTREKGGELA